MRHTILTLTGCLILACGGSVPPTPVAEVAPAAAAAPVAPPEPKFGSVAFQTYVSDGRYMKFINDTKVKRTWNNMVGGPMKGTFTQDDVNITVVFEPATNSGIKELRFRQLDDCVMANWYRADDDGINEENTEMYKRTEPRCPHK